MTELFHEPVVGRLLSDGAEVRSMLLVLGALAKAQGSLGLIPADSAAAIDRASRELLIDPAQLATATGKNGVVVPALVAAFREAMSAPEHASYVHWGATSQDIMETGLILRLRRALEHMKGETERLLIHLADLAETHAETPMAGRTYGQHATVTSFGAVVATWGAPLIRALDSLTDMRPRLLVVSLSGAAGTLSAMGADGPAVRAQLAADLGLGDPGGSWHSQRDRIAELAAWLTRIAVSLGKFGEDITLGAQPELGELRLTGAGSSSTMPQKANPVGPSVLGALASYSVGLSSVLHTAGVHRQERDGAAWFSEWLALPQLVLATSRALATANDTVEGLEPRPERMSENLRLGGGLIFAEALSFALARQMPRPEAQGAVKALCADVAKTGTSLADLANARWPETDLREVFEPRRQLGTAPVEARHFAAAARAI
ncbi:MAG: adenylosuccinate lyase family protein [Pseudomonadota bacterium]